MSKINKYLKTKKSLLTLTPFTPPTIRIIGYMKQLKKNRISILKIAIHY